MPVLGRLPRAFAIPPTCGLPSRWRLLLLLVRGGAVPVVSGSARSAQPEADGGRDAQRDTERPAGRHPGWRRAAGPADEPAGAADEPAGADRLTAAPRPARSPGRSSAPGAEERA